MTTTRRRRPALVALVILASLGCLALGWWQWSRWESSTGSFQNLGYAFQWPLFAWFVVYAYRRYVTLEAEESEGVADSTMRELPPDLLPPRPQVSSDPGDATLAEYNRILHELNEKKNGSQP